MRTEALHKVKYLGVVAFCLASGFGTAQSPIPLPAHSHNDYDQPRPLFSALQRRFASVEADIFLVENELRVGHGPEELVPGRTLTNLYLEPLRLIITRGAGQVYPETTRPLILLIDIKSDAESTYLALERALIPYERYLTRYTTESTEPGAVTVVVSGNRPRDIMKARQERYVGFDGRLTDLSGGADDRHFMPLVSDNWDTVFDWRGNGAMPPDQRSRLDNYGRLAREQGVMLRFWNTPDTPPVWSLLEEAGVGLINTDRIEALSDFLNR